MKTIEERKNLDSFWELIKYNRRCISQDDWLLKENWLYFLRGLVKGNATLLDIACHDLSVTRDFDVQYKCGIDAKQDSIAIHRIA